MKQLKHIMIRFILLFYLSSSFLSAMHVHHDISTPHDNCKICLIVKNLSSGDIPTFDSLEFTGFTYGHLIVKKQSSILKTILKGFFSNAPPLFT